MGILVQIDNDLKQALKAHDELKCSVLRMIKSAVKNAEIKAMKSLSEEETLKVISSQAKQRKDSIEQFGKAGRNDLVDREKEELTIVESYLPDKMSDEDVRKVVLAKISDAGDDLNFGKVMGMVMKQLGQSADGQTVREILQEELEK